MSLDDRVAAELGDNEGPDENAWHDLVRMPDDDTQTLADVLYEMRGANLQRRAAFVEWLAGEWYETRAELQWRDSQLQTDEATAE